MATALAEQLANVETITFDCYGTLVDWRAGIERSLMALFGKAAMHVMHELFEAYDVIERSVEAGPYVTYREVLARVTDELAEEFGIPPPTPDAPSLADSLGDWPAFTDTNEALKKLKSRFRLGVLSNVDRDLFAGTTKRLAVEFDFIITAQDVRSYKPAHAHFERLLEKHASPDTVLHVAQSLFHDAEPSCALNIPFVWINRYRGQGADSVTPLATFEDLESFADEACGA